MIFNRRKSQRHDMTLKKYNFLNDSHIPANSRFSPVSQVIGIRPGQICRIQRPSKTSITTNFYRICSQ